MHAPVRVNACLAMSWPQYSVCLAGATAGDMRARPQSEPRHVAHTHAAADTTRHTSAGAVMPMHDAAWSRVDDPRLRGTMRQPPSNDHRGAVLAAPGRLPPASGRPLLSYPAPPGAIQVANDKRPVVSHTHMHAFHPDSARPSAVHHGVSAQEGAFPHRSGPAVSSPLHRLAPTSGGIYHGTDMHHGLISSGPTAADWRAVSTAATDIRVASWHRPPPGQSARLTGWPPEAIEESKLTMRHHTPAAAAFAAPAARALTRVVGAAGPSAVPQPLWSSLQGSTQALPSARPSGITMRLYGDTAAPVPAPVCRHRIVDGDRTIDVSGRVLATSTSQPGPPDDGAAHHWVNAVQGARSHVQSQTAHVLPAHAWRTAAIPGSQCSSSDLGSEPRALAGTKRAREDIPGSIRITRRAEAASQASSLQQPSPTTLDLPGNAPQFRRPVVRPEQASQLAWDAALRAATAAEFAREVIGGNAGAPPSAKFTEDEAAAAELMLQLGSYESVSQGTARHGLHEVEIGAHQAKQHQATSLHGGPGSERAFCSGFYDGDAVSVAESASTLTSGAHQRSSDGDSIYGGHVSGVPVSTRREPTGGHSRAREQAPAAKQLPAFGLIGSNAAVPLPNLNSVSIRLTAPRRSPDHSLASSHAVDVTPSEKIEAAAVEAPAATGSGNEATGATDRELLQLEAPTPIASAEQIQATFHAVPAQSSALNAEIGGHP